MMVLPEPVYRVADVTAISMEPEQGRPCSRIGDEPAVDFNAVRSMQGEILKHKADIGRGTNDLFVGGIDKLLHDAAVPRAKEENKQEEKNHEMENPGIHVSRMPRSFCLNHHYKNLEGCAFLCGNKLYQYVATCGERPRTGVD